MDREDTVLDPGVGLIASAASRHLFDRGSQATHPRSEESNPLARVHVKIVRVGVGTVAAGVSKAHADVVLILSAWHRRVAAHVAQAPRAPWSSGWPSAADAPAQRLRDRIVVHRRPLKTGRDGDRPRFSARRSSASRLPFVVSGCVMMRVCHLDRAPSVWPSRSGAAQAVNGKPEFVVTFFEFLARRSAGCAELGFRSIAEAVVNVELLDVSEAIDLLEGSGLDSRRSSTNPRTYRARTLLNSGPGPLLATALPELLRAAAPHGTGARAHRVPIRNQPHRGHDAGRGANRRCGGAGLPTTRSPSTSAARGSELRRVVPRGTRCASKVTRTITSAKACSVGLVVHPDRAARFKAKKNVIAGNVVLYGARRRGFIAACGGAVLRP